MKTEHGLGFRSESGKIKNIIRAVALGLGVSTFGSVAEKINAQTEVISQKMELPGIFEKIAKNKEGTARLTKEKILQNKEIKEGIFTPDIVELVEQATRQERPLNPNAPDVANIQIQREWANNWAERMYKDCANYVKTKINMGFGSLVTILNPELGHKGPIVVGAEGVDAKTKEKVKLGPEDSVFVGFGGNPTNGIGPLANEIGIVALDVKDTEDGRRIMESHQLTEIDFTIEK